MTTYIKLGMSIILLQLIFVQALFGGGAVEESKFTYPVQVYYVSPANQDGVQDTVEIEFTGNIEAAAKRKLTELEFNLFDERGVSVMSDTADFTTVSAYTFDGKDDQGNFLPDGYYVYTMSVKDDKGNISSSQPYPIIIDNTPPDILTAEIVSANVVSFESSSPVTLHIIGSKEVLWRYVARTNGFEKVIFEQKTDSPDYPPKNWDWLGIDSGDNLLADGTYTIRIESQDLAGNTSSMEIPTPLIVSQRGAFQIKAIDGLAFSPNGDASKDTLPIQIILPQNKNELDIENFTEWKYVVETKEGEALFSTPLTVSERLEFTGLYPNGLLMSDGEYQLYLSFMNGDNEYLSNKLVIVVDTEAPLAAAFVQTFPKAVETGDPFYFGGDERTRVDAHFRALEHLDWSLSVYKEIDNRQELLIDVPVELDDKKNFIISIDRNFKYNGSTLLDGAYLVNFYAIDSAGNKGGATNISIIKDTADKQLTLTKNKESVSAFAAPVRFSVDYTQEGVKYFTMSFTDKEANVVKSTTIKRQGAYNLIWNAYSDSNIQVPNGVYDYMLTIAYFNGTTISATGDVVVDSIAPSITEFKYSSDVINPTDDTLPINTLKVTQSTDESDAIWTVEIRNIFEQTVYTQEMNTELDNVEWNGKDAKALIVPDGDYYYVLVGKDAAGNRVIRDFSFIVDTGSYNTGKVFRPGDAMPAIFFPAYSEDIFSYGDDEILYENLLNIRSVARMMKAYPDISMNVVGHAAALLKGSRAKREQSEVLIPLSRGRADQIRRALLILGVEEARLTTTAVGGSVPLIRNASAENLWQNRRVEFLVKE